MRVTSLLTVVGMLLAAPAFATGSDDSSHGTMNHDSTEMDHSKMGDGSTDHGTMDHGAMKGVHTTATINAIDGDTYNVSHPPIPELKWPAMTMDLKLLEGAEVGEVGAGEAAMLMLEKDGKGMYGIRAVMPAK